MQPKVDYMNLAGPLAESHQQAVHADIPNDPTPILSPRQYFPALRPRKTIMVAQKAKLGFFVSFVAGAACSGFTPNAKARYEDDKDGHPGP